LNLAIGDPDGKGFVTDICCNRVAPGIAAAVTQREEFDH